MIFSKLFNYPGTSNTPYPRGLWIAKHDCVFESVTELDNYPTYIRSVKDKNPTLIEDEVNQLKYIEKTDYSASLVRYAILLKYTSLQSYKVLQEVYLPSLLFLKKFIQRSINSYITRPPSYCLIMVVSLLMY